MTIQAVSAAALAGLLVVGAGAAPAQAADWRVFSDYLGQTFLVMKKSDRKLRYVDAGEDWTCFRGKKRGSKYRGQLKTVIDTYRGWAKVRRVPGGPETPPGIGITYNYGYGVQRSPWLRSRASTMRANSGVTVRELTLWCS